MGDVIYRKPLPWCTDAEVRERMVELVRHAFTLPGFKAEECLAHLEEK